MENYLTKLLPTLEGQRKELEQREKGSSAKGSGEGNEEE